MGHGDERGSTLIPRCSLNAPLPLASALAKTALQDRTYVAQHRKLLVYDNGTLLFRDHLLRHADVRGRVQGLLLAAVRDARAATAPTTAAAAGGGDGAASSGSGGSAAGGAATPSLLFAADAGSVAAASAAGAASAGAAATSSSSSSAAIGGASADAAAAAAAGSSDLCAVDASLMRGSLHMLVELGINSMAVYTGEWWSPGCSGTTGMHVARATRSSCHHRVHAGVRPPAFLSPPWLLSRCASLLLVVAAPLVAEEFESPMLAEAAQHYHDESREVLARCTVGEYLAYAERRLEEERARCVEVMHHSTLPTLLHTVEDALVADHATALATAEGSGLAVMLQHDR